MAGQRHPPPTVTPEIPDPGGSPRRGAHTCSPRSAGAREPGSSHPRPPWEWEQLRREPSALWLTRSRLCALGWSLSSPPRRRPPALSPALGAVARGPAAEQPEPPGVPSGPLGWALGGTHRAEVPVPSCQQEVSPPTPGRPCRSSGSHFPRASRAPASRAARRPKRRTFISSIQTVIS